MTKSEFLEMLKNKKQEDKIWVLKIIKRKKTQY
jgi:hypothetical protein